MNVSQIYRALLVGSLCAQVAAQPQVTPPEIASRAAPVLQSLSNALARADWEVSEAEASRLVELGPQVVPLLVEKVKSKDGSSGYCEYLVRAIANIGRGLWR